MTGGYRWNRTFRLRILALCIYEDWFTRYGTSIIKPEYFETREEQEVAEAVVKFYQEHKRSPYDDELLTLVGNGTAELVGQVYDMYETGNLDFAERMALRFAQEQAMKLAILDSVDDITDGDLSAPLDRVRQAQQVGADLTDLGLSLKDDLSWIYDESATDKVPTGIFHLDAMMEGGLGKGELGVVMAATNVGKSMALINIGCGAASIHSHCNVVHVTCEMSARKVARRYGARTVFRWLKTEESADAYKLDFQDKAGRLLPGSVHIKEFHSGAATVADVEAYMERLEMSGVVPDILIVDYPDEMKHTNIGEYRQNVAHTFRELRRIAGQRDIPVWGATQAARRALSKQLVTLDDIAESYEKATVSDIILAMCQTQVEKDDDEMRLFAAKIRDNESGWMIRCRIVKEAHAITSTEVMSVSQMWEEKRQREVEA